MKGLVKIVLLSLLVTPAIAAVEELKLQCRQAGNSSSLVISMIQPIEEDDCVPNDDCEQTSGWFVLRTDLTNPAAPIDLDRYNDSFTEKEEKGGLKIEQFGDFTIQFPIGFRSSVESFGETSVTITSFVSSGESQGEIQLNCTK